MVWLILILFHQIVVAMANDDIWIMTHYDDLY